MNLIAFHSSMLMPKCVAESVTQHASALILYILICGERMNIGYKIKGDKNTKFEDLGHFVSLAHVGQTLGNFRPSLGLIFLAF